MHPREALQHIVDMFSSGDVTYADAVFADTYIDHQKPEGWDEVGPGEFKKIVALARGHLPNLTVTVADSLIEGDKIAARLKWVGDDARGMRVERETLEVLHLREGKVIEHWGAQVRANVS